MAFSEQSLVPLSRETQFFSLFSYETDDFIDEVGGDAYFKPAASLLRRGDILLVYAGMTESPAIGLFVVTEADPRQHRVQLEDFAGLDIVKGQERAFRLVPHADARAKPATTRSRRPAKVA